MHGIVFLDKSKIYGSKAYELKEFVVQNRWIPLCLCKRRNLQCLLYHYLVYCRNVVDYKHIKSQIFMIIPFNNSYVSLFKKKFLCKMTIQNIIISFVKCDCTVIGTKAQVHVLNIFNGKRKT